MPRLRVIVLDSPDPQAARTNYRMVFWADVPAARRKFYASPGNTSAWLDALPADNTALQNGSVVERVMNYQPDGTKTLAVMEAEVQVIWTAFQSEVNGRNTWANYGSTWDGTTWSIATVA